MKDAKKEKNVECRHRHKLGKILYSAIQHPTMLDRREKIHKERCAGAVIGTRQVIEVPPRSEQAKHVFMQIFYSGTPRALSSSVLCLALLALLQGMCTDCMEYKML